MNTGRLLSNAAFLFADHPMLERLLAATTELAALSLAAALLVRVPRFRVPRPVQMVWLVVLIKPLMSLCCDSFLPVIRLDPLAPRPLHAVTAPTALGADLPGASSWSELPVACVAAGGVPAPAAVLPPVTPPPAPPPERLLTVEGAARFITNTWIAGAFLAAASFLVARVRLGRRLALAPSSPGHVERAYHAVAGEMSISRPPRLVVSDALDSPALVGVVRPWILVPTWLAAENNGSQLRWALRHELTHWRRHDPIGVLLRDVVRILFWFHPAAAFSARRMTEAMELACDRAMVRGASQRTDYAEQLLAMVRDIGSRQHAPAASALFASRSQVSRRIAALVDGRSVKQQVTLGSALGLLAFATVALAVGGINTTVPEPGTDAAGGRILEFPRDRSLGRILVQDADLVRKIKDFHHWIDGVSETEAWTYLCEAHGAVSIPPGKRVQLDVGHDAWQDLRPLALLPPDAIYELSVAYTPADDRCMPHIARLTGLVVLDLCRSNIGDAGLRHLRGMTSLERLHTPRGLTDAGMVCIGQLRSLRGLYLGSNRVTDVGVAQLANLTGLAELSLGGKSQDADGRALPSLMTEEVLFHLSKLPNLWYLALWGDFADTALYHLRNIPSLRTLNLSHLEITDEGLRHLAACTRLEVLDLYGTKVTDAGLVHLKSLPSLRMLDLGRSVSSYDFNAPPITDAGMAVLKHIRTLEHLNVPYGSLTAAGLEHLAELEHLRFLWAQGPAIGDAELKQIGRMKSLETLLVGGQALSLEGLTCIADLPKLRHLNLNAFQVDARAFPLLAELPALESLDVLSSRQNIGISALNAFSGAPRLRSLDIGLIERDGGVLRLENLPGLEALKLSMERGELLADDDIACVANMKNLKQLTFGMIGLGGAGVTDAGLAQISGLTALERLYISGLGITDRGLAELADLSRLWDLGISGAFGDAGLRHLESLHGLTRVTIRSSGSFSAAAVKRLRSALPHARLLNVEQDRAMGPSRQRTKTPSVGDRAPDFELETIDGTRIRLADYEGKTVLLYFWGTWCAPCMASTLGLRQFHAALSEKCPSFAMLSLAMDDDNERFRNVIETEAFGWPQARIGLDSRIAAAYGVTGAPSYVVIDPDGVIVSTDKDWNKLAQAVEMTSKNAP